MARPQARSESIRDTVIGPSTRIRGRVTGDGALVVEGAVEGDVDAGAVTVRGVLEGDVRARGVVHLEAGARVRGDLHGESVAIDEGAEFVGRLDANFELPAELGGAHGGKRR
jgi:cytoskeletal protein CcmA (bactofilin family)